MRGISGAYLQLANAATAPSVQGNQPIYNLAAGSAKYGYSSNYDFWHDNQSTATNLKNFLSHTRPGAAVDLGVEYLVKSQPVPVYGDDDDYFGYAWKIGVSLLDILPTSHPSDYHTSHSTNP